MCPLTQHQPDAGTLHIVATPIGNLDDITQRALTVLRGVDLVAAEDTRRAGRLFSRHYINNQLYSYHDHNKEDSAAHLLQLLRDGADVALISEAGTPSISDPGFFVVRRARSAGIPVVAIPGPCAAVAALSISGLPSEKFLFGGFAPRGDRLRGFLTEADLWDCSLVLYDSPERVLRTLEMILEVLGDRTVSVSRELTKIYEETLVGPVNEVMEILRDSEKLRGEFTMVIAPDGFVLQPEESEDYSPADREPPLIRRPCEKARIDELILKQVQLLVEGGYRLSEAVRSVARGHDIPRSRLYNAFLKFSRRD